MAFQWKGHKDIWKGEGVYHLTFVVSGRRKMLGTVVGVGAGEQRTGLSGQMKAPVEQTQDMNAIIGRTRDMDGLRNGVVVGESLHERRLAWVELSAYGKAVDDVLRHYDERMPGIKVCTRMVMDDHIHVVLWVQQNLGKSILQIAYGMRVGFTHLAQEMGVWPKAEMSNDGMHAEKGVGHVFEKQFVRTLSHRGQMRAMIDYVQMNPYRRWMKGKHPELFVMHKDTWIDGLRFRSMGNHWLLDWPVRQMVECSRSITEEDLETSLRARMVAAEQGAVTYTAAISEGERRVIRAIREAHWPVVILMKDGFPAVGSEQERYFKPGGVYFDACAAGRLLLLEAYPETYEDRRVVMATDGALKKKAESRGWRYEALPHSTMRWKFMAGNEVVRMLTVRADVETRGGWWRRL